MRREAYNVIVANPEFGSFTAQAPDEPLFKPCNTLSLSRFYHCSALTSGRRL
jgi:hypothetical protein